MAARDVLLYVVLDALFLEPKSLPPDVLHWLCSSLKFFLRGDLRRGKLLPKSMMLFPFSCPKLVKNANSLAYTL
jgi:hypothetical protein